MMNLRTLTLGINIPKDSHDALQEKIIDFHSAQLEIFKKNKIQHRTNRICTNPISKSQLNLPTLQSITQWLDGLSKKIDIRWFCLPFNFVDEDMSDINRRDIVSLVKKYSNLFVNLQISNNKIINSLSAMNAAKLILDVSRLSNNGFDNFRIGVSSNCNTNTPFFPFSFHTGDEGFSIGLESLKIFFDEIDNSSDINLEKLRDNMIVRLSRTMKKLDEVCSELSTQTGMNFLGIDCSIAPFPDGKESVARLVEKIGLEDFGANGTLFFTSYLTNIIEESFLRSKAKKAGFNGVMYSVLEDDFLAESIRKQKLNVDSLMLYSTVCGCGIDMVPVPGNIFKEEIYSIIMDTSALSLALKKPLGTRLLPIPNKFSNEITDFNYDFLVDTRIINTQNSSIKFESIPTHVSNLGKKIGK